LDSSAKRFLINLVVVALAGWLGGNWLLGGPSLSKDYLESHRVEHEHYLEIVKSDAYKRYMQRPHLVDLESDTALRDRIGFVETYVAQEAFESEQHRLELRSLFFDFFNVALVVVLVIRFARRPFLAFIDGQIETIRERLNQAARSRKAAAARVAAAREKHARLHEEELRVNAETEHRLERELADLASASHYSLGQYERDLAERKKAAEHAAELTVRRRLVEKAIEDLKSALAVEDSPARQDQFVAQFIDRLEGAK
jgi:F0F1-type ATP synthase membrane subunit b/b'